MPVSTLRGVVLVVLAFGLQGCAALPLMPLLASATGSAVQVGAQTVIGGFAYRTFTLPSQQVTAAVHESLRRMDIQVGKEGVNGDVRTINAEVGERIIEVVVERVTATVTKIRVVVYHGVISKDVPTSTEIVRQIEDALKVPSSASRHSASR